MLIHLGLLVLQAHGDGTFTYRDRFDRVLTDHDRVAEDFTRDWLTHHPPPQWTPPQGPLPGKRNGPAPDATTRTTCTADSTPCGCKPTHWLVEEVAADGGAPSAQLLTALLVRDFEVAAAVELPADPVPIKPAQRQLCALWPVMQPSEHVVRQGG